MPDAPMNFFVLTSKPDARVMRLPLSQELQIQLSALFRSQEQDILGDVHIDDYYRFDGRYRPEEKELLYIEGFDDIDKVGDAVRSPLGLPEFSVGEHGFDVVKGVFCGYLAEGTPHVLVQVFDKRRIISAKGFSIIHGGDTFRRFEGAGMTLDSKLTAILQGKKLVFRSFHFLRQLFDVEGYFREATDADVTSFCCATDASAEKKAAMLNVCDGWIRRKIGLVKQSGILDKTPVKTISQVAESFDITVETKEVNGQAMLVFPETRADLKRLLRFLDEDYYQSPLSDSRYVSNSKTVAVAKKGK